MIPVIIVRLLIVAVLTSSFLTVSSRGQDAGNEELRFAPKHRVNAHGNEFNGLAKSADGRRLFIATEKGEIIVWNIALGQAERTLRQPSAVHFVAPLPASSEILVAGSNHHKPMKPLVRKWNVETGTFVDLAGLDESAFPTALATETKTSLAAVTTENGELVLNKN